MSWLPRVAERLLEPVVAPEQFAARNKARRAKNAAALGFFGVGAQAALDLIGLRAGERRSSVMPDRLYDVGDHGLIGDVAAFGKFSAVDRAGKILTPALVVADQRDACREQRVLRERLGQAERNAEFSALSFAVAHHVAALGGIEIDRLGVPALRLENRSEQERPPAHRDARALGKRRDAHRRDERIS